MQRKQASSLHDRQACMLTPAYTAILRPISIIRLKFISKISAVKGSATYNAWSLLIIKYTCMHP